MQKSSACALGSAVAALVFGLPAPAGATTVYKWIDARGVVNYSTAPPPDAPRVVAINAAPALDSRDDASAEEARYWRERRQRETLREIENLRLKRETEELRQVQIRHQMMLSANSATSDAERLRLARERCLRERRVDCDSGYAHYSPYYYQPVVLARRSTQGITQAAPFPLSGSSGAIAPGTIAGTQAQLAPFRAGGSTAARSGGASVRITR